MKRVAILIIASGLLFITGNYGQTVPSSCSVPPQLFNAYEKDIKNLTLRRMYEVNAADTSNVTFGQDWMDTISEGLAAIFNATSIPERDTIFNIYCVHDNTSWPAVYNSYLVRVDTNYAWTDAWQTLTTNTGNAYIDTVMARYDLHVDAFYNWGIGNYAEISTPFLFNSFALIDTLLADPGIISGEPNAIIGSAGQIRYTRIGNTRYYEFAFEFNDCFDGCDNSRTWTFMVNPDCSVFYIGYQDWGFFQIEPLPSPINCFEFAGIEEPENEPYQYSLFPNPADEELIISSATDLPGSDTKIVIYNMAGQPLLNQIMANVQQTVNIAGLSRGMYLLVISDGNKKPETHRFIKR